MNFLRVNVSNCVKTHAMRKYIDYKKIMIDFGVKNVNICLMYKVAFCTLLELQEESPKSS